jgi:hypothetical protein
MSLLGFLGRVLLHSGLFLALLLGGDALRRAAQGFLHVCGFIIMLCSLPQAFFGIIALLVRAALNIYRRFANTKDPVEARVLLDDVPAAALSEPGTLKLRMKAAPSANMDSAAEPKVPAASMAVMEDFVAYPSRGRIGLLILGSIAFVLCGLWMGGVFGRPPPSPRHPPFEIFVMGWLGVIFSSLCGISATKQLFSTGEQLRIGPDGIRWVRWSDQTIPWPEISKVTSWAYKGQKSIIAHLRNPALFPGRGILGIFGRCNRTLTGGDFGISLFATNRNFDEAMSAVERFHHNEFTKG